MLDNLTAPRNRNLVLWVRLLILMDFGAYFRARRCFQYRRTGLLYSLSGDRVAGPNVVDMPVSGESMGRCGDLLRYYASLRGPCGENNYTEHLQSF